MLLLIRSGLPLIMQGQNDYACEIVGIGDVQLKFQHGSTFTLKNVRHVPKLTKSLISAGQLDDAGFSCVFGDSSWKITKGSLVVARGSKSGTLYMLHVSTVKNHVICVTEQPSVSLWHRRLCHMSQSGMKILSRFGHVLAFTIFLIFLFVNIVCMVNKHSHHTKGVALEKVSH